MLAARSAAALVTGVLLLNAAFPAHAQAQVVTGQLVDASAGRPIATAFVQLIDAEGVRLSGALTDSAGRFTLQAPSAGEYRLVAERLGYEPVTSPALALGTSTFHYVFELNPRALVLPSVEAHVEDSRGCRRRTDGASVVALWNAVRSALNVTSWAGGTGAIRFSMMNYHRELDLSLSSVKREVRTPAYATAAMPYNAVKPDQLARDGYAIAEGETTWLLGLDADVMLSDSFLDSHCFRIVSSPHADRVGLGFTPLRDDGMTDVSGVLWVDRTTAELRYLEFEYENLPEHMRRFGASGEVHFERLSTGAWIITRWWIRSPLVGLSRRGHYMLLGYSEDGGTVTSAESIDADLYGTIGGGVIEGVVHDRVTNRPLADALVFLSGTPFSAVSDSTGTYRIRRVPAGQYSLGFTHPLLEEIGVPLQLEPVRVAGDTILQRDFVAPSMAGILRALCPGEQEDADSGLLYGFVKHEETGEPLAGVEVRASWRGPPLITSGTGTNADVDRWRTVTTDSNGRYTLCWLPTARELRVRADSRDVQSRDALLDLSAGPILRHDF
ncbi:MAG TPA: carboxypeptidase regulatory-like domain-containing protein [Longimicrobiales bacterium]|nr:carboxypeptidase regulatory-like domain-containing protein [Longimicrobiales bacterium]